MPKQVRISVLLPIYNEPIDWIKKSIDSILQQTEKNFELLLIDDNSRDNAIRCLLKEYSKKDYRIVTIYNQKNVGLIKSLNIALDKSRGSLIARMDADDISEKNRLEIQSNYLKKNPDVSLVGSNATCIDEQSKKLWLVFPEYKRGEIGKKLEKENVIIHSTIMFRNNCNLKYREKAHSVEDYDLYLRMLSREMRMVNLDRKLLKYRINQKSVSTTKPLQQALFAKKVRSFYFERKKNGTDSYDLFIPDEIYKSISKNVHNELQLRYKISINFKQKKKKSTRKHAVRYISKYGFFSKALLYYCATFFQK